MEASSKKLSKDGSSPAAIWISFYFVANLALTIHNKWVLSRANFKFPWILTACHVGVSGLGSWIVCQATGLPKPKLDRWGWIRLLSFSILYAINIAMSNVSLAHVSLSFHQIVRSSVPAFILILEWMMLGKGHSASRKASLIPLIFGVALSTVGEAGELYFTCFGLGLTLFGVFLAALKGVVTNMMMVGPLAMHPLQVIAWMALPAAAQCLLYAGFVGELQRLATHLHSLPQEAAWDLGGKLAINALLAFLLNWVSFTANQRTSALTMTVVANVKQIASIALAIYIFGTPLTLLRAAGIALTLGGAVWYSFLAYRERGSAQAKTVESGFQALSMEETPLHPVRDP